MIYCCAILDLPRRISALQWVSWLLAAVGVFLVLFAHGHYTIDIIIAYYITTRLFWTYHTLANNSFLIKVNRACNCITLSICEFSMSPISIKLIKLPFTFSIRCHTLGLRSTPEQITIWRVNGGTNGLDISSKMYVDRYRMNLNGLYRGLDDFSPNSPIVRVNGELTTTTTMMMIATTTITAAT